MTRPRGILNRNALSQLSNSLASSGILRSREVTAGNHTFDVNQTVVQLQKNSVFESAVGRVQAGAGINYVPTYEVGIGVTAASGFTTTSPGIYQVDANVAVSGAVIETYAGTVLVDGVEASGTTSFQSADARGAACVNIHGVVHADTGQVINVGVKSLHATLTTVGNEDLVHAPAANMRIVKLGSDELSFN